MSGRSNRIRVDYGGIELVVCEASKKRKGREQDQQDDRDQSYCNVTAAPTLLIRKEDQLWWGTSIIARNTCEQNTFKTYQKKGRRYRSRRQGRGRWGEVGNSRILNIGMNRTETSKLQIQRRVRRR